jgi:hypothetical protein
MSVTTHDLAAERTAEIKAGRDRKMAIVLDGTQPAWIVGEQVSVIKNSCVFDVVFRYQGRWVQRRYTYDAEVDVLHFAGETPFDEARLHTLPDGMLFVPPAQEEADRP